MPLIKIDQVNRTDRRLSAGVRFKWRLQKMSQFHEMISRRKAKKDQINKFIYPN